MIDNEFYKHLGEKWFTAEGDAVALLRRENEVKAPWVAEVLERYRPGPARVLDVGCGGGFLAIALSERGHRVTGVDVDQAVMAGGRARGPRVRWEVGTAESLPFADQSFDAVCVMDVLEHVTDWRRAVAEATRVLAPGGLFVFHTFNRTPEAWLFAARGLDWFIRDSPRHVHDWRMFIRPRELEAALRDRGFGVVKWQGIGPRFKSVVQLVLNRRVPKDFAFRLTRGTRVGYLGAAVRTERPGPRAP